VLVGEVAFTVQEGAVALAALYGEVHVNPAGTAFDRVIANLQWGAYTRPATSGSGQADLFPLNALDGSGGLARWTYSNGEHPVALVMLAGPIYFRFGAVQAGALDAKFTKVLARVRGLMLPAKETSVAEQVRLLQLVR